MQETLLDTVEREIRTSLHPENSQSSRESKSRQKSMCQKRDKNRVLELGL